MTGHKELLEALVGGTVQFVTVAELAALARLSKTTIYRMVHSGELDAIQPRGSAVRIAAASALQMLSAGPGPGGEHDGLALRERLRRLRGEFGLTQQVLADRSGLSVGTVSNTERGRTPHRATIAKLAAGLHLPVAAITGTPPAQLAAAARGNADIPEPKPVHND